MFLEKFQYLIFASLLLSKHLLLSKQMTGFELLKKLWIVCCCSCDTKNLLRLDPQIFSSGVMEVPGTFIKVEVKTILKLTRAEYRGGRSVLPCTEGACKLVSCLPTYIECSIIDSYHDVLRELNQLSVLRFQIWRMKASTTVCYPPRPRSTDRGKTGSFVCESKADIALKPSEPFRVISSRLIPWVVIVVDYPASLVLDFLIGRDLPMVNIHR